MGYWKGKQVTVTGGASFIGSHLCEALLLQGAHVRVIDNLSTGRKENLTNCVNDLEFIYGDLFDEQVRTLINGSHTVFHLAAKHGGRGYVHTQHWACASNLALDNLVFSACVDAMVEAVVYASSGCVYPNYLQSDVSKEVRLREYLVPPLGQSAHADADGMYGWAKLMAEYTLQTMAQKFGMHTSSCRYFTAYGPRAKEDHAIMAMIGRAFIKQDPFEIWGDGSQIRNWTWVGDIVEGTLLAGELLTDGTAVNIGTTERTSVDDAAHLVCRLMNHTPQFRYLLDKPTGPLNRVADNTTAGTLLGWKPKVDLTTGVIDTIDWYVQHKTIDTVLSALFLDN